MVFVIRKQEISTPIMKADGCSIVEAWTEKFVLDVFRDGFSICRGPLGSGLKKNWGVAALKYLSPATYVPCPVSIFNADGRSERSRFLNLASSLERGAA